MASTYSADEIVGKTLIANKKINLYRLPNDSAKPIFSVDAGSTVGVVFSYLKPSSTQNRSSVYWVFNDANGKQFYARHKAGDYDVKALKDQGALTTKEKTEEEKGASIETYIKKYGIPLAIGVGVLYLAGTVIKAKL